jgi:hypothetical protein
VVARRVGRQQVDERAPARMLAADEIDELAGPEVPLVEVVVDADRRDAGRAGALGEPGDGAGWPGL